MIARLSERIERLFYLALSRGAPRDERERRSRSVVRGTISAVLARGVGVLTGIISVPLTVRYLGTERYGVWVTISSMIIFLSFTDLGLASSFVNAVSKAYGEDNREKARHYISTIIIVLSIIAILLVIAGVIFCFPLATLLFPKLTPTLMRREIVPALIIALVIFAASFPLLIANRALIAYQENEWANLWIALGGVANLLGILFVIGCRGGLPWLVLGSSAPGLLVHGVSVVWLFGWHKSWLWPAGWSVDIVLVRELFSTGWKFFIINAAWLINTQTDNLVIAHYLGPAQVTPYSVTFRLFAYATLIQTLAFPSVWPAITEAVARKDFDWVRGTFQKNLRWSFLVAVCIVGLLTVFGKTIIRIWAGEVAVPPFSAIVWMGVWNLMLCQLNVSSWLLMATGRMTGLTIYGTITAILNLTLSIILVRTYGITGVIAGTVIAYAIASYLPIVLEAQGQLNKFAIASTE